MSDERPETMHPVPSAAKKRRMGKRGLRWIAWGAGLLGFALPWAAIQAVPEQRTAAAPQVVVVPAGSRVVVPAGSRVVTTTAPPSAGSGVVAAKGKGGIATPPVTKTGGSAPPAGV
jgi:hypothetical protein